MTTKRKNKGVNMKSGDVKSLIADKKKLLVRQEMRLQKLQESMERNKNTIEQLEYTSQHLEKSERQQLNTSERKARKPRVVLHRNTEDFVEYLSRLFDRIQSRFNYHLNYTYFCLVVSTRYWVESRFHLPERKYLSPATLLGYFKRERGFSPSAGSSYLRVVF